MSKPEAESTTTRILWAALLLWGVALLALAALNLAGYQAFLGSLEAWVGGP